MKHIIYLITFSITVSLTAQNSAKNEPVPTFDKLLKLKWKINTNKFELGNPVFRNGLVFFTSESDFAVDAITGKQLFFNMPEDANIVRERCSDSIVLFSYLQYSYLIDIYHAKQLNQYTFHHNYPLVTQASIISNSDIIRLGDDKSIKKIKIISRYPFVKPVWGFSSQTDIYNEYLKFDSIDIVFNEQNIYGLNDKNGKIVWQYEIGAALVSNPVIEGNFLYFIIKKDNENKSICSFNLISKTLNWKYDFPYYKISMKLINKNEILYFVGNEGLYFIDGKNGTQIKTVKGSYSGDNLSQIDKYIIVLDEGSERVPVPVAIDMSSGKICYRKFTSSGYPPITIENMSEEAKDMRAKGIPGWEEGLGWNTLDGGELYLVEDKETGLIYGNNGTYYCFELIKK